MSEGVKTEPGVPIYFLRIGICMCKKCNFIHTLGKITLIYYVISFGPILKQQKVK